MTDLNPVDAMTTNPYRAMCAELVDAYVRGNNLAESIFRARTLLDQPEPQPVPVSERLPEPNDCNDEGYCWWWRTDEVGEWWEFLYLRDARDHNRRCGLARYTHWLPYHAITNLPNPND